MYLHCRWFYSYFVLCSSFLFCLFVVCFSSFISILSRVQKRSKDNHNWDEITGQHARKRMHTQHNTPHHTPHTGTPHPTRTQTPHARTIKRCSRCRRCFPRLHGNEFILNVDYITFNIINPTLIYTIAFRTISKNKTVKLLIRPRKALMDISSSKFVHKQKEYN